MVLLLCAPWLAGQATPALGAAVLAITPVSWGVIGLDSNNELVGPNVFQVGARVCNTGDAVASNLVSNFVWDSTNLHFTILTGTNSLLTSPSLAPNACVFFNYAVAIDRDPTLYNQSRAYHI